MIFCLLAAFVGPFAVSAGLLANSKLNLREIEDVLFSIDIDGKPVLVDTLSLSKNDEKAYKVKTWTTS